MWHNRKTKVRSIKNLCLQNTVYPSTRYSRLSITRIRTGNRKSFRSSYRKVRVMGSRYRERMLDGTRKIIRIGDVRVIEVRVIESLL